MDLKVSFRTERRIGQFYMMGNGLLEPFMIIVAIIISVNDVAGMMCLNLMTVKGLIPSPY